MNEPLSKTDIFIAFAMGIALGIYIAGILARMEYRDFVQSLPEKGAT